MSEIDALLDWLLRNVHHLDNIRHVDGQWSVRLWLTRQPASNPPLCFHARALSRAVDDAVDAVFAWKHHNELPGRTA